MTDLNRMRAELDAAERAEYERLVADVALMTYDQLGQVTDEPGFDPDYEECDRCPSWDRCWHRAADRRRRSIDRARRVAEPGNIDDWMTSSGTFPAEHVRFGDFLRTNNPLPGVSGFGGYVEVLAVECTADSTVITVARTNDPDATPVEHHYPPETPVDVVRPLTLRIPSFGMERGRWESRPSEPTEETT